MIIPTEAQQKIIEKEGNLIVSASAGTGKTFTLVKKIAKEVGDYKGFKKIAAITFTIKATREIKERLDIDAQDHFIGTNNSFAIEEVIKPFLRDVFGPSFQRDMSPDYNEKFNTINEGLNFIQNRGIIGCYYENKSNFIFELALKILTGSKACRLYLKAKYKKIYIDEYQDCDRDMHQFFMALTDLLHIEMFIVGDEKQAIYRWRGACPDLFEEIKNKENFTFIPLFDNHRSCVQIQNYSNLLFDKTKYLYKNIDNLKNIVFLEQDEFTNQKIEKLIDLNKSIAILRFKRQEAENVVSQFREIIPDCVYLPPLPITEIANEYSWLIQNICRFCVLKSYSKYMFLDEMPNRDYLSSEKTGQICKGLDLIKKNILNKETFHVQVKNFCLYFNYKIRDVYIDKMYESITDKKFLKSYTPEQFNHVSITFHSSKGLEFDQVIVFTEDFPLDCSDSYSNHYVAVTRAKEKLMIINNYTKNSRKFNANIISRIQPRKLEDLVTIV